MKADPKLEKLDCSLNNIRKTAVGDRLLKAQRTAKLKATENRQTVKAVLEMGTKRRTLQHAEPRHVNHQRRYIKNSIERVPQ